MVHWGEAITPNHHALARTFVALDRFFDAGGVSGDGWQWSMSGRSTDVAEKAIPIEYANRGKHSYDWEGSNRNVNVSWPTAAERLAWNPKGSTSIDLLPGIADVGAVDGPDEGGRGFLWDAALAAGLTVRNYGAFCRRLALRAAEGGSGLRAAARNALRQQDARGFPDPQIAHDVTDPYFRCFDMNVSDVWRFKEWARELDDYVAKGTLPALEIVRMPHHYLGNFESAVDGVNTPDTQVAGGDYALGLMVEKLSRTPFWKDTILIRIEDDAQNGSDHVDAHRSYALFAGGYARRGAVVSTPYATPSVLRTIELLLGLAPLGQPDVFAPPMAEVLDTRLDETPFPRACRRCSARPCCRCRPPAPVKRAPRRAATPDLGLLMQGQDFTHAPTRSTRPLQPRARVRLARRAGCTSEAPPIAAPAAKDDDD